MNSIFCTLAIGELHSRYARYLAQDLRDYGARLLVLTDQPDFFRRLPNVTVKEHRPQRFTYHDKRHSLRAALDLSPTAIFVDADSSIQGHFDDQTIQNSLTYSFPPGLHGWRVCTIAEAGEYVYPEVEAAAISWGLFYDRDRITYQERLFAVTSGEPGLSEFFQIWDRFAAEAESRNYNGAGEGTCIGIAAEATPITKHYARHMSLSGLPDILNHTRMHFPFGLNVRPLRRLKRRLSFLLRKV